MPKKVASLEQQAPTSTSTSTRIINIALCALSTQSGSSVFLPAVESLVILLINNVFDVRLLYHTLLGGHPLSHSPPILHRYWLDQPTYSDHTVRSSFTSHKLYCLASELCRLMLEHRASTPRTCVALLLRT